MQKFEEKMVGNNSLKLLILLYVAQISICSDNLECDNEFSRRLKESKHPIARRLFNQFIKRGPFQMCKSEWNSHGSCCEPEDLNKFSEFRFSQWTKVLQSFINKAKEVKKFINENRWILVERMIQLYEWVDKGNLEGGIKPEVFMLMKEYIKKPEGSESPSKFDLDLFYFIENEANFEESYQKFVKGTPRCFRNMIKFQQSMMCFECSGRAKSLIHDHKLKIHQATCRPIVERCVDTWTFVYSITQISKAFVLFNEVRRKYGTAEAPNIVIHQDELGPDTTLLSGLISFNLREIQELGFDQTTLFYLDEDEYLCDHLLTIDVGNDDIMGNARLIEKITSEFEFLKNSSEMEQLKRDALVRKEKYKRESANFEKNFKKNMRLFIEQGYKQKKTQYEAFVKIYKEDWTPRLYKARDICDDKEKTFEEKDAAKDDARVVIKEFTNKKKLLKNSMDRFKKYQVNKLIHGVFSYSIKDERTKNEFIQIYKDVVVWRGRARKVNLPPITIPGVLNDNSTASFTTEQRPEFMQEKRILEGNNTKARDTVLVVGNLTNVADLMNEEDGLPSLGDSSIDMNDGRLLFCLASVKLVFWFLWVN